MRTLWIWEAAWLLVATAVVTGATPINLETVPVGNPGNAGEWSGESCGGSGPDRICGAVDYTFNIGKYEVTAGQYTEFLNAVAATDTYGLYNTRMWTRRYGCKILRSGTSGNYTYSVASDYANRPANYVSYWDACRFANWLHNGQPTGEQEAGTTERGAYTLDGYSGMGGQMIQRDSDWKWAVTSEDEWYKGAYHMNNGVTGDYFDYPTGTDSVPSNVLGHPTDPGNNATFYDEYRTIGNPYWRTEVGAHENSDSPYGTFDQGGNVVEWNEAVFHDSFRGHRGGSFFINASYLRGSARGSFGYPTIEGSDVGFRVVEARKPTILQLDILPSDCPNEFTTNLMGKGKSKLPMAIRGGEDFDVTQIDVDTISIQDTIFPVKTSKIDDVTTFMADGEVCDCHVAGGDGIHDLTLHFLRRDVIQVLSLNTMDPGTVVRITVKGDFLDGTAFEATDCIVLVARE
jgi:formylglycine-generating enzyme required for sulfatase activity